MPEGDSIRRLSALLDARLAGAVVRRSTFRAPRLATLDLTGRTFVGAGSYGKHLFLRFDDGTSLAIHLLLQGRVTFGRVTAEPWRRRFELGFADGRGVVTGVDVPRLERLRTVDEPRLLRDLGPDVCGAYDHDAGVARLLAAAAEPLGGALLDQRVVAGLGNIYAVEAPFVCGVDPRTPVGDVAGADLVLGVAVALIRENARRGPQNTTGRDPERSDHWVLDGSIRSCRVCRSPILRLAEDRTSWRRRTALCPTCQPVGPKGADADRAVRLLSLHPARRLLDPATAALTADTTARVEPVLRAPGR